MSMKEAFDIFFKENEECFLEATGRRPYAVYVEGKSSKEIFDLSTLDKSGRAETKAVLQDKPVNFEEIEKELGFSIHPQIKDYLSTYWFMGFRAKFKCSYGSGNLMVSSILPDTDFKSFVTMWFDSSDTHYLHDHNYFLLAPTCCIEGNDEFLIQVNNETGEVDAVECMDRKSIKLYDSIEDLLINLKGIYRDI